MTEILRRQNLRTYFVQFSPDSLLGVSTCIFHRALVDEFVMIKAQMGTRNRSENGRSCRDTLYYTT
jgi:hypothetical protein